MTKKKSEELDVAMEATELNEEEKDMTAEVAEATEPESIPSEDIPESVGNTEEQLPKKRRTAKKKAEETLMEETMSEEEISIEKAEESSEQTEDPLIAEAEEQGPTKPFKEAPILTIAAGGTVQTDEELAEIAWHEIHNAYRTRRILTGVFGGIEQFEGGRTVCVVEYKGYRIVIPFKEMNVAQTNKLSDEDFEDHIVRQQKLLSNMLGAEIDFIVKGIDSKTRSVVASRRDAMLKKRKTFYMETDGNGEYMVYEGRIVQVRVVAVAEKAIRIEAFGVECSVMAKDLSWDWLGDARDRYSVGDEILVRIQEVNRESIDGLSIKVDVKSVSEKHKRPDLSLCRIQSKYAGRVTDIYKGIVYIRLTNGINAIAHSCLDRRMPAKKDEVSFAVTSIDEERGVALGVITRIIKQNL